MLVGGKGGGSVSLPWACICSSADMHGDAEEYGHSALRSRAILPLCLGSITQSVLSVYVLK